MNNEELGKAVNELTLRLVELATAHNDLVDSFKKFVDMDREWSKSTTGGVDEALNRTDQLADFYNNLSVIICGVAKHAGMTSDEYSALLDGAEGIVEKAKADVERGEREAAEVVAAMIKSIVGEDND
jgi:hypothetical protein